MNLKNTLTFKFILLILLNYSSAYAAVPEAVKVCNDAVNKGDATAAISQAEAILNDDAKNHEGLLCKARAQALQNDYQAAQQTFNQALEATNDGFSKVITYILLGNLHQKNTQTDAAIQAYSNSLQICAETGNQTYTRINHNLIGDSYKQAGDLKAAIESYKSSVSVANNDNERADSFGRLAAAYNAVNDHNKAIEFQLKSAVMQQKAGTLTEYAEALLSLGQFQFDAKEYASAKRSYQKLVKLGKDNGGAYYEAKANYKLAETLAADGDKASAKTLMADALALAKKIGAGSLAEEISQAEKKLSM